MELKNIDEVREYRRTYMKEYYKLHPEKINTMFKCDICNKEYTRQNKSHHMQSKKHQYNLLYQQLNNIKKMVMV